MDRTQHLIEQAKLCGLTWTTAPAQPARRARWERELARRMRARRRDPLAAAAWHTIAARKYRGIALAYNDPHALMLSVFETAAAAAAMATPRPCQCAICRGEP